MALELVFVVATVVVVPAVILVGVSATMRFALDADIELPRWSLAVLNAAGVPPAGVTSVWPPVPHNRAQGNQLACMHADDPTLNYSVQRHNAERVKLL